jgi:hypothetical protein
MRFLSQLGHTAVVSDELFDVGAGLEDSVIGEELLDIFHGDCGPHRADNPSEGIVGLKRGVVAQNLAVFFGLGERAPTCLSWSATLSKKSQALFFVTLVIIIGWIGGLL